MSSPEHQSGRRPDAREAPRPDAIILAAGKGTRMRSDLPKVVHPVGGRAMVCAVVDACLEAGCGRVVLVVGYQQQAVRDAVLNDRTLAGANVEFAVQAEQLGTGHAVMSARAAFGPVATSAGDAGAGPGRHDVFVLAGDGPLVRAATLRTLLARHREHHAAATMATALLDDPTGYGRIERDGSGRFARIVEHKDATPAQREIREVNPSYYCFNVHALFSTLERVGRNPASGEYYLTDVPALLLAEGKRVEVVDAVPPEDVLSINTPEELAKVDAIYRARQDGRHSTDPRRQSPGMTGIAGGPGPGGRS